MTLVRQSMRDLGSLLTELFRSSGVVMPYERNADLPYNLQRLLPEHAQDIYREAFNHAYAAHADEARQEEAAHRIAWAAVKRSYVKTSAGWRKREEIG